MGYVKATFNFSLVTKPGPKQTDVLSQDLEKYQSHKFHIQTFPITLKFDRHLCSSVAEMPVKFESDNGLITLKFSHGFETSQDLTVECPSA